MNPAVQGFISSALKLSDEELREGLKHITALRKVGVSDVAAAREKVDTIRELYDELSAAVKKARGIQLMPYRILYSKSEYAKFQEAALFALKFIDGLERGRIKSIAVLRWCCRLVVDDVCKRSGFSIVSTRTLTGALLMLPSIIDKNYPGYLNSKTGLNLLLSSLYRGSRKKMQLPE